MFDAADLFGDSLFELKSEEDIKKLLEIARTYKPKSLSEFHDEIQQHEEEGTALQTFPWLYAEGS
jgi:hypothetical protein